MMTSEYERTTRRAEEIRERTGCSWEHACTLAESERDGRGECRFCAAPITLRDDAWCDESGACGCGIGEHEPGGFDQAAHDQRESETPWWSMTTPNVSPIAHAGASPHAPIVAYGPSVDCGCGLGRLCDGWAYHDGLSVSPLHNGHCWAYWQGTGVRLHGRDSVEYRRMACLSMHGPLKPDAS